MFVCLFEEKKIIIVRVRFFSVLTKLAATANKGEGYEVYDVDADDADGDAVFYTMSTTPNTNLFDIGYSECLTQSSSG